MNESKACLRGRGGLCSRTVGDSFFYNISPMAWIFASGAEIISKSLLKSLLVATVSALDGVELVFFTPALSLHCSRTTPPARKPFLDTATLWGPSAYFRRCRLVYSSTPQSGFILRLTAQVSTKFQKLQTLQTVATKFKSLPAKLQELPLNLRLTAL